MNDRTMQTSGSEVRTNRPRREGGTAEATPRRLRPRGTDQHGFTLIELLVVILIIGILAAVAIPVFVNQTKKAVGANVKSDLNSAATAEETFFTDNQGYVSAVSGSSSNPPTPITAIDPALTNAFTVPTSTSGEGMAITSTGSGYMIVAYDPTAGLSGVEYTYTKNSDGSVTRRCQVPANANPGGCKSTSGGEMAPSTSTQVGTW